MPGSRARRGLACRSTDCADSCLPLDWHQRGAPAILHARCRSCLVWLRYRGHAAARKSRNASVVRRRRGRNSRTRRMAHARAPSGEACHSGLRPRNSVGGVEWTSQILRDVRGRGTRRADVRRLSRAIEQSKPMDCEDDAQLSGHGQRLLFRRGEFRFRHGSRRSVDTFQSCSEKRCPPCASGCSRTFFLDFLQDPGSAAPTCSRRR